MADDTSNVSAVSEMPDKITPTEARQHKVVTEVNGRQWAYLDFPAKGQQNGTAVLIHGFPDCSLAWRYQIPLLNGLGFRCIALDCMGYGDTGTSDDLRDFGFKSHADAVEGICYQIGASTIILGGHDWGGAAVYRIAQWKPQLVSHVFSVCTPYFKVFDKYVSTQDLIDQGVKQFGYQLQWGSEDGKVEAVVNDERTITNFLVGAYGGKPKSGRRFMDPEKGVDLDVVREDEFGMTPLLTQEELDYYIAEYMKNGIRGPCNWYRTRKVNYEDDLHIPSDQRNGVQQPVLYVFATGDMILNEDLQRGMAKSVPNLTKGSVPASHWALWHTPVQTNEVIKEWVEGVVFGRASKL